MTAKSFIQVMNNLVPEDMREALWTRCMSKNWYFGPPSRVGSRSPFWKMDLDDDPAVQRFWESIKATCEARVEGTLSVLRQYANGHTYGLGDQIHQDDHREGTYTLLYYPMPSWEDDWEGETIYKDPKGEIIVAIKPAPNRAVLFDSRIPHVGRAPARSYGGLRVTIAFKLRMEVASPSSSLGSVSA